MNADLLSKIGAGGAKKNAPAGAKLGKSSTGTDPSRDAGAFSEQLELAGRSPSPHSQATVDRKPVSVSEGPTGTETRVEREETPAKGRERGDEAVESRRQAPRFKKVSASAAKEPGAEAKPAREVRNEASLIPASDFKPVDPDFGGEEEMAAEPQATGVEAAVLRQQQAVQSPATTEEPTGVFEQARGEQGQVRRQAMQDFMNQMQREFGIPPEKIVEAFSRLDEEALMRPPEESTKQFLANLEVPASKQARAAELYNTMVRTTGEAALNEKLTGGDQDVRMAVLSPRDQALRKLNEAIDQLNNSFALRGQGQMTSLAAPLDNPLKAQFALEQMNSELAKMERSLRADGASQRALMNQPQSEESDEMAGMLPLDSGESDAFASASPLIAGALAMPMGSSSGGESASSMSQQFGRDGNGRPGSQPAEVGFNSQMKKAAAPSETTKSFAKKMTAESAAAQGDAPAANVDASLAGAEAQTTPATGAAKAAGPAGMIIQRPTPTAQDEEANVKELIRQAQLAIKKGGGEIKMDLKPEGIGQLHLKVSLENGQVNVQMLTDNDASKRLLEKGLHELKSNLAAHELKVDTMKVDVGQELKKHMDNSGDQAREQTRQFANDVMSQFREERQAFRDGFMQNQGWRQPGRNYGQPESGRAASGSTNTAANTSNSARARARNAYSSGRLDLVA